MEGGTAEKDTAEEKESDDHPIEGEGEYGKDLHHQAAAGSCLGSSVDYQDLPIMHWEDLSLRIAELEKQEQERRERTKPGNGTELATRSGARDEERQGEIWKDALEEEAEDVRRSRLTSITSRFHNRKNLQLCFINNSDSEEDEDGANKKVGARVSLTSPFQIAIDRVHHTEGSRRTGGNGYHPSGLKQEVAAALRALRDKVLAEQRGREHLASSSVAAKRKHLESCDLQNCSLQQLTGLKATLQQDIHDLSSELVAQLLVRDQLRTKQDAMLLDVQDLT
ncbi:schwannomin-interacting protein 1 isoform X1 [Lampris incognitus]|uniref:schwannomin-interacting protein 1 isoform X1 n=1 Tax=Lampris incognitus TaxID=2546036 RepID=UPI0024B5ECFE|nr:schwannomin-interacting protein 1 isoform X1 [Lampris incognitus]